MAVIEERAYMLDLYEFLEGRLYVLDGIEGRFEVTTVYATYPYPRTIHGMQHVPTAKGRKTEKYQEVKRELRDHWDTDLSDNIERVTEIAHELGYREPAEEKPFCCVPNCENRAGFGLEKAYCFECWHVRKYEVIG